MRLVEYPKTALMMDEIAREIASELGDALELAPSATLVVPGGTTPGPIFDGLSGADLPWDRLTVLPSDERCVPESDDRSNARLIKERLLTAKAASTQFLALYDGKAQTSEIADAIDSVLPITVLLLGMGADMHTASLFPGASQLGAALASDAPAIVEIDPPGANERRVTLSAPVLAAAKSTHIAIVGRNKRLALERAQHLNAEEAPVRVVLESATVHWAEH